MNKAEGVILRILDQLLQQEELIRESLKELSEKKYEGVRETLLDCAQLTSRQISLLTRSRRQML